MFRQVQSRPTNSVFTTKSSQRTTVEPDHESTGHEEEVGDGAFKAGDEVISWRQDLIARLQKKRMETRLQNNASANSDLSLHNRQQAQSHRDVVTHGHGGASKSNHSHIFGQDTSSASANVTTKEDVVLTVAFAGLPHLENVREPPGRVHGRDREAPPTPKLTRLAHGERDLFGFTLEEDTDSPPASPLSPTVGTNSSSHAELVQQQTSIVHVKARTPKYFEGPTRFPVPDKQVPWHVLFLDYTPPEYTAAVVLAKPGWADDESMLSTYQFNRIDSKVDRRSFEGIYRHSFGNLPLNPKGRTGLRGRGLLGRFGPNHAADPIVTRWIRDSEGNIVFDDEGNPEIEFVAIKRKDTGEWALPGGMVDAGEHVSLTLRREFGEETMNTLGLSPEQKLAAQTRIAALFLKGTKIYQGYVDDPRNTDNAWMETVVMHFHDATGSLTERFNLKAGDDAGDVAWKRVSTGMPLYASHTSFVMEVANRLRASALSSVSTTGVPFLSRPTSPISFSRPNSPISPPQLSSKSQQEDSFQPSFDDAQGRRDIELNFGLQRSGGASLGLIQSPQVQAEIVLPHGEALSLPSAPTTAISRHIEHTNDSILTSELEAGKTGLSIGIDSNCLDDSASEVVICPFGVSKEFLELFHARLCDLNKSTDVTMTTSQICELVIRKQTAKKRSAYVEDYIGKRDKNGKLFVANATIFVSHAWNCSFQASFDVMMRHADKDPQAYFWFDLFVNNQNINITTNFPFHWWTKTFQSSIERIGSVLLVLSPWNDPHPLKRAWCLFEILCSLNAEAKGVELKIELPSFERAQLEHGIEEDFNVILDALINIRAEKAQSFKGEDRDNIFRAISNTVGFDTMNRTLKNVLRSWYIHTAHSLAEDVLNSDDEPRKASAAFANFMNNVGRILAEFGFRNQAITMYQKNISVQIEHHLSQDLLLKENPECADIVCSAYLGLGKLHDQKGETDVALEYINKSLSLRIDVHGQLHPDVANCLFSKAEVLLSKEEFDLALDNAQQCLSLRKECVGDKHLLTAAASKLLSRIYRAMGEEELALKYLQATVAIKQTSGSSVVGLLRRSSSSAKSAGVGAKSDSFGLERLGGDTASIISDEKQTRLGHIGSDNKISSMKHSKFNSNLSESSKENAPQSYFKRVNGKYLRQDVNDEELKAMREDLEMTIAEYGEAHTITAKGFKELSGAYLHQGDFDSALDLSNKHVAALLECYGEKHPDVASAFALHAVALRCQGNFDSALAACERGIQIAIPILGSSDPILADLYREKGSIFYFRDQGAPALDFAQRVLDIQSKVYGSNHSETADALADLGDIHFYVAYNYVAAEEYYLKAKGILSTLVSQHSDSSHQGHAQSHWMQLISVSRRLAMVYVSRRQFEKALLTAEEVLRLQNEHACDSSGLEQADTYELLGDVHYKKDDYEGSLKFCRRALEIRLNLLGEAHEDSARSYMDVAYALQGLEKHDEAATLITQAHTIFKSLKGDRDETTINALITAAFNQYYLDKERCINELSSIVTTCTAAIEEIGSSSEQRKVALYDLLRLAHHLLSIAYFAVDNSSNALKHERARSDIALQFYGDSHILYAFALCDLGECLLASEFIEEGLSTLRNALDLEIRHLGRHHCDTLKLMQTIACALAEQGELEESRKMQEEVVGALEKQENVYSLDIVDACLQLEAVLEKENNHAGAISQLRKCISILVTEPKVSDRLLSLKDRLATLLSEAKLFKEEIVERRDLVELMCRTRGEEHLETVVARMVLAQTLLNADNSDEAFAMGKKELHCIQKSRSDTSLSLEDVCQWGMLEAILRKDILLDMFLKAEQIKEGLDCCMEGIGVLESLTAANEEQNEALKKLKSESHMKVADILMTIHIYPLARQCMERALLVAFEMDDDQEDAHYIMLRLGLLVVEILEESKKRSRNKDDLRLSLELLTVCERFFAEKISESDGNARAGILGTICRGVADAYYLNNDFYLACEKYHCAAANFETQGDSKGRFQSMLREGDMMIKLNETEKALEVYTEACDLLLPSGPLENDEYKSCFAADVYLKLGETYCLLHQTSKARDCFRRALNYCQEAHKSIGSSKKLEEMKHQAIRRLRKLESAKRSCVVS